MQYCRSYLFVPGHRPDLFGKAQGSAAHALVLDLEDAVPPELKERARADVANWLSSQHPVVLRINASDTAWFEDDLLMARHPGVQTLMLPKVESLDVLHRTTAVLAEGKRPLVLLPLIESARGFDQMPRIARFAGVQRLVFGSIDFQQDLGISGDGIELQYFRSQMVLASRLARLMAPVDGVCTNFAELEELRQATTLARRNGFGAKLCIHPRQVDIVNAGFSPSAQELDWARRVLAAAAAAQGAAVALDGCMIDKPVLARAQALLSQAG